MGMYDELKIAKELLPEKHKEHETGWQTKSLDCLLDLIIIDKNGYLFLQRRNEQLNNTSVIENSEYTGEIRFYDEIHARWVEYCAFFEKGKMFKLIEI